MTQTIGIGFLGGTDMETVIRSICLAEEYGFRSAWIAEDYFYGGAFATAGTCASKTSKIQIGIGVVNPYTRHPVLTAMEAAALDLATQGRFILGMGTSNPVWMERRMGIPFEKPMGALRESVEIIQQVTAGKTVNYQGKVFNVNNVQLEFAPYRSHLPIYLGVKGPQALKMAGTYSDGVLMSIMSSVEYVRYAMEHIKQGRAERGKDMEDFAVAAYVILSVDEDRQKARDQVKPMIAKYLGLHGEHPILTCTGMMPEDIAPFREAFLQGRIDVSMVTEEHVNTFAIAGTSEECQEQLEQLRSAGVTHPIAFEILGVPIENTMQSIVKHLM